MTYTEKELDQFLHGISLSLLSKKSAQHWRYDEETAKEIEWLEALERKVRADKADRKTENSSEKPNNCEDEPQTSCKTCRYGEVDEGYVRCAYYSKSAEQDEPLKIELTAEDLQDWKDRMWAEAIVTESQTERSE